MTYLETLASELAQPLASLLHVEASSIVRGPMTIWREQAVLSLEAFEQYEADFSLPYSSKFIRDLEENGFIVDLESGDIFRDPDAGGGNEEAQG